MVYGACFGSMKSGVQIPLPRPITKRIDAWHLGQTRPFLSSLKISYFLILTFLRNFDIIYVEKLRALTANLLYYCFGMIVKTMCSEYIAVVVQRKHTGLMPRRRGSNPTAASKVATFIREHREGGVSKAPPSCPGAVGDRYRVKTCPEKA